MTEEKKLGLDTGGGSPAGDGQPGNKETPDSNQTSELESEIDNIIGKDDGDNDPDLNNDDDEETVVLPKKQVEKILRDKNNYKQGLLSVKDKLKGKKNTQVEKPAGDVLTKTEFHKNMEKEAIEKACEDSTINDNWNDIVKYYSPKRGKDSVKSILADIDDAKTLWEKHSKKAGNGEDKGATAELGKDKGKPGGSGEGGKPQEKKSVLTKRTPVQDWYPDSEKKEDKK